MKTSANKVVLSLILVSLQTSISHAVGSSAFSNQIVDSKAFGMGNVFVAQADAPAAIYFNPAGLTQLDRPMLSIGAAVLLLESDYETRSGQSVSMDNFTPVVPNFYFSSPAKQKWAYGIGVNSPFGLETHWGDTSPLRYLATDSHLTLVNINPTVAYEVNDRLSLGFGVVYGVTDAKLRSRVNQTALNSLLNMAPTLSPDGGKKLQGSGDAWGYNAGVLLRASPRHRWGLSYRSELKSHIKGSVELSGLEGAAQNLFGGETYETDAETDIKFPETLILGYAFTPGRWVFEIDGEWAHYSRINETNLTFTQETNPNRLGVLNSSNPTPRDWKSTWNMGVGANYTFNDTWQARGGYFHYPRVIPTATFEPTIPESSHNGFTLGGTFSRSAFSVDAAYNYIVFNKRSVTNNVGASSLATVNGTYETTAHIFATNVNYKF